MSPSHALPGSGDSAPDGLRTFGAPHRYVQGPGALDTVGQHAAVLGRRAFVFVGSGISPLVSPRLADSFEVAGTGVDLFDVDLEVTRANIDWALAWLPAPESGDVVVGVGGGKALDLARGVAWLRGVPFITVPTVASNDSPAAMAVALYDDDHHMVEVIQTGRNPDLVLVDTALIVQAPPRLLSAGIGDAVAKKFEARSCSSVGGLNQHGTRSLLVASAIADYCFETLREFAPAALAAAARRDVDDAFEQTVEACILMSGLAFENGGLSIAHSVVRGLQRVRGARDAMHGEHVAYGLLVQLALEEVGTDELHEMRGFLDSVALPTTLAALGLPDPTDAEMTTVVDACLASPHRHKTLATVSDASLRRAIERVEAGAR